MTMTMTPKEQVNDLLKQITHDTATLDAMADAMEAELTVIRAKYTLPLANLQTAIGNSEKAMKAIVKAHRDAVMAGKDRAKLPYGSVMLKIEKRVKKIKGMLAILEGMRLTSAIKTAKSVDWDVLEHWDDATLEDLGTKRVETEQFSYELKTAPKAKPGRKGAKA